MTQRRGSRRGRGSGSPRTGKIILLLAGMALLIAVGFYIRHITASAGSRDADGTRSGNVAGARHYDGLTDVRIPAGIDSQLKDYEGFTLSFNAANRTPNWVAWELLGSETDGPVSRGNRFWQDTDIEGCPDRSDYTSSGYDRGHLCPAADQKWSGQAMSDCFVMANMCPQAHALNSGAWSTLEKKERLWAERDSALVIVAGPIYESSDTQRIGDAGVRVPSAFFKVMIAPYLDSPRGIAFVYPNMTAPGNMQNYVMTIDEVEQLTGFDFFHNLPDDIERIVESTASFKEWNR